MRLRGPIIAQPLSVERLKISLLFVGLFCAFLSACESATDADAPENNTARPDATNPIDSSCPERVLLTQEDLNGGPSLRRKCYRVEQRLTVTRGLFKLKPGTSIVFSADAGLRFSHTGGIAAVGTADEKITFSGTAQARGHWRGLYFDASNTTQSKLAHVVLAHAGSAPWHTGRRSQAGVYLQSNASSLSISNSTFVKNARAALFAESGDALFSLDNTAFIDNESPLWLHANQIGRLASLSFSENDNAYILTGITPQEVTTDQIWKAFELPYRAEHTLSIQAKLNIDPGVTIEFKKDAGVEVGRDGALIAQGTGNKRVSLSGVDKARGAWKGIYFNRSASSENRLAFARVEYAGGAPWRWDASTAGVYLRGSENQLTIRDTIFRENAAAALFADGASVALSVESSTFENNALPIWLKPNAVGQLGEGNRFADNDAAYILLGVDGSAGEVSTSQTWLGQPVPYRARQPIEVTGDLRISPGTTLTFEQDLGLTVDGGSLRADGSGGRRIKFIAADDKTSPGSWAGIFFIRSKSDKNIIANADILYGGGRKWHGGASSQANIFLRGGGSVDSSLALSNVKIAGSAKYGISVEDGSTIAPCENVRLSNNTHEDISGDGASACR